jgi:hypothetical protein
MMTRKRHYAAVATWIAIALLGWGTAEAGSNSIMIPAAAFSADGTNQSNYVNYGDSLETNVNLHFHAWVKLPNLATITNVDMMTLDDDTATITMYLKRTKFGFDGGTETLLTFTSPGNIGCSTSGLCHDMESLLDIEVDASNYGYWFDLYVPDAGGSPENDLAFYAVRIMYDFDEGMLFADNFESSTTVMWSGEVSAKSGGMKALPTPEHSIEPAEVRNDADRFALAEGLLDISDPGAREALENALAGKAGYSSPYVIPGPAFKTAAYTEYDDYYFSESYGFVYGRPAGDGDAVLNAPVILPDGAHISWFFAIYVDSVRTGTQADIRFWLSRMDAADIVPTDNMVYEVTSGRNTAIETITVDDDDMEAAVPGSTVVDNDQYSYWVTIDVGPYDISPPDPYGDEEWWHKVYAIVILYTTP